MIIEWYTIINWSVLCKKYIVVFKAKITVKAQTFIESFVYFISSVPLTSWQPNKVCLFTIHNNQTKYNKEGI